MAGYPVLMKKLFENGGAGPKLNPGIVPATGITKEEADNSYLGKNDEAASAVKATKDADNNVIPETYVKKSQITSGTEDLTAGSSALATGSLYFMYE